MIASRALRWDAARAVFRTHIEAQGGRIIDTAGDSVLASFETATGAVRAAIAIQRKLSTRALGQRSAARLALGQQATGSTRYTDIRRAKQRKRGLPERS